MVVDNELTIPIWMIVAIATVVWMLVGTVILELRQVNHQLLLAMRRTTGLYYWVAIAVSVAMWPAMDIVIDQFFLLSKKIYKLE